jgi:nitroimidazol reductase NimA-like FMN-containing flavoprotein (pyridoxamine 5'-phosphate oxidase superfamily)
MRLKKAEREFLMFQRVCRLATVGKNGRPHNVPVCPVLDRDRVYFGSAADAVKVQNIQGNSQVALVYDEYTEAWAGLKGVLVWGTARVVDAGPTFRRIQRLLYQRFPQYEGYAAIQEKDSVVVEVTPARTFSWGL